MRTKTLTALAVVMALAPHGIYAQSLTLQSGDHITVDGTGTHGVMKGRRVDNKITSYMSHGKVFGVDNDAVQVNGTAAFTLGDGGTITGGSNGIALEALGNSRVTVTGGTITCQSPAQPQSFCYGTALSADDTSLVTVSGGTITGGQFGPALAT